MRGYTGTVVGLIAISAVVGGAPAAFCQNAATGPAPVETPAVFKSGVDVVALGVTVTDRSRQFVSGLSQNDFAVTEDGVPQQVTFFAVDRVPVDLAILLDTSSSMNAAIDVVHQAALGLVKGLRPSDRGTVVEVKDAVRVRQALTSDIGRLEHAVLATKPSGDTSLFTGIYITLSELDRQRRPDTVRRQAMVVLSDGVDTTSPLGFDDVLDRARRSGVTIYFVSLAPPDRLIWPNRREQYAEAGFAMRQLASETGGTAFRPQRVQDLVGACSTIARELSAQYTLGYVSTNQGAREAFRRISVSILNHPDLTWRTRPGYYARSSVAAGEAPDQR
jgi:VWFA-related protein